MLNNKFNQQSGVSQLLLILIVASVIAFIILAIQIISLLQAKQAATLISTQQTYFAAEGALFETFEHLRNDNTWPAPLPYEDNYKIDQTDINRKISIVDDLLEVKIDAITRGTKRTLVASFKSGDVAGLPNLDVVLVLDRSGSMNFNPPITPLVRAKEAALAFVDIIEASGGDHRVGLVTYAGVAFQEQDFTNVYDDVRIAIQNISAAGVTNIADAISKTLNLFSPRDDAKKVIILLSDGVPNRSISCIPIGCVNDACPDLGSGFSPDNLGHCCTQDAINQATLAKNNEDYVIFSIALSPTSGNSQCLDITKTNQVGQLTLLRVSSEDPGRPLPPVGENYPFFIRTSDPAELEDIFKIIGEIITSPDFFEYQEVLPQP